MKITKLKTNEEITNSITNNLKQKEIKNIYYQELKEINKMSDLRKYVEKRIKNIERKNKKKIRKDAVKLLEIYLTASSKFF